MIFTMRFEGSIQGLVMACDAFSVFETYSNRVVRFGLAEELSL